MIWSFVKKSWAQDGHKMGTRWAQDGHEVGTQWAQKSQVSGYYLGLTYEIWHAQDEGTMYWSHTFSIFKR